MGWGIVGSLRGGEVDLIIGCPGPVATTEGVVATATNDEATEYTTPRRNVRHY